MLEELTDWMKSGKLIEAEGYLKVKGTVSASIDGHKTNQQNKSTK